MRRVFNSRDVILPALDMLLSKGVVKCDFSNRSVRFSATELGTALYKQIEGDYKHKLVESIMKAHELMGRKSDSSLNTLVYGKMAEWGSEFSYESVFNEIAYEE